MDLSYWFMTPLGVLVACTAMATGISASNFWIPIYLMVLGFDPMIAFWLSLLTMMFGYGSGTWRNTRAGRVHWPTVRACMAYCGPAAVLGGLLAPHAPKQLLLLLFGTFVMGFGSWTLYRLRGGEPPVPEGIGTPGRVCLAGGFLQGLISTGLGKLLLPKLMHHRDLPHHANAVGTAVVITFFTSLCALIARMDGALLDALAANRVPLTNVLVWEAPGVVLGGQLAPYVAAHLSRRALRTSVGVLLILAGALIIVRAAF